MIHPNDDVSLRIAIQIYRQRVVLTVEHNASEHVVSKLIPNDLVERYRTPPTRIGLLNRRRSIYHLRIAQRNRAERSMSESDAREYRKRHVRQTARRYSGTNVDADNITDH